MTISNVKRCVLFHIFLDCISIIIWFTNIYIIKKCVTNFDILPKLVFMKKLGGQFELEIDGQYHRNLHLDGADKQRIVFEL